ncbi:MAG: di-trans,poly-cis-decaprenylcistransferase [Acidobacteria bacterium]|nr:di-trans,poly-cis-decaprenylcistransferase [Acidobacteriota bacterium]
MSYIRKPVKHLAVIMDGNGRWAERRGLPRWRGHEAGVDAVRRLAEAACRFQIPVVTAFAFSSENWKRPEREVRTLFRLFERYFHSERNTLPGNGIRVSVFGRRDRIPNFVREAVAALEAETRGCSRLHLRIALDYGGRHEIVEAARSLARRVARGELQPGRIDEELFSASLSGDGIGDPDLVIRTAGERRLSNFLLWQAAYSELYFCSKLWPDFDESDLQTALADYESRTRRFGALPAAGVYRKAFQGAAEGAV